MANFSEITHGFQPALKMSEIIDAVNERRSAAIASGAYGLPSAIGADGVGSFQGGNVKPTHLLIQEMLEALAPRFVDHRQSGYTDTSETQPIAPFTVSTWRAAAGLNSSGFRRATEWDEPSADPTFDYGLIQTGDIAGYWIWQDIVSGIQALRWTRKTVTNEDPQRRSGYGSGNNAIADADADWMAADWVEGGSSRWCWLNYTGPQHTPTASAITERTKHKVLLAANAPVAVSVEFWWKTTGYYRFFDPEGYNEDSWNLLETRTIAAGGTTTTTENYNMAANPVSNPLFSAGITGPDGDTAGCQIGDSYALLKWNFSRT